MCLCVCTYAGNAFAVAHLLGHKSIAYLPGEYRRALSLEHGNFSHNFRRRNARLRASDRARPNCARLEVPAEDLTDASVGHLQNARNIARTSAAIRQLDDLQPYVVRQWTAVDVCAAQLVDT